ncbi:hypothetical protein MPER_10041, partial [Moniliophthora perniciosa FA553]
MVNTRSEKRKLRSSGRAAELSLDQLPKPARSKNVPARRPRIKNVQNNEHSETEAPSKPAKKRPVPRKVTKPPPFSKGDTHTRHTREPEAEVDWNVEERMPGGLSAVAKQRDQVDVAMSPTDGEVDDFFTLNRRQSNGHAMLAQDQDRLLPTKQSCSQKAARSTIVSSSNRSPTPVASPSRPTTVPSPLPGLPDAHCPSRPTPYPSPVPASPVARPPSHPIPVPSPLPALQDSHSPTSEVIPDPLECSHWIESDPVTEEEDEYDELGSMSTGLSVTQFKDVPANDANGANAGSDTCGSDSGSDYSATQAREAARRRRKGEASESNDDEDEADDLSVVEEEPAVPPTKSTKPSTPHAKLNSERQVPQPNVPNQGKQKADDRDKEVGDAAARIQQRRPGPLSDRQKDELDTIYATYLDCVNEFADKEKISDHACHRYLNDDEPSKTRKINTANAYRSWFKHQSGESKPPDMSLEDWNDYVDRCYTEEVAEQLNAMNKYSVQNLKDPALVREAMKDYIEWYEKAHFAYADERKESGRFGITLQQVMKPILHHARAAHLNYGVHVTGYTIVTDRSAEGKTYSFMWGGSDLFHKVKKNNKTAIAHQLTDLEA